MAPSPQSPLEMTGWKGNTHVGVYLQSIEGPQAERGDGPRSQPITAAIADSGGTVSFAAVPAESLLLLFGDRGDRARAWVSTMVAGPPTYG